MAYLDKLLSADEKILVQRRLHWAMFVSTAIGLVIQGAFFLVLLRAFHFLSAPSHAPQAFQHFPQLRQALEQIARQTPPELFNKLTVGVALLFAFIVASTILKALLVWMTNLTVVTNVRVLQMQGLFSKTVVDSSLEKINDVLLQQSFLGRLFGYGTLVVMTASETGLNRMYYLKDPVEFKRIMMDAKRGLSESGGTPRAAAESPSQSAADRLAALDDLRKRGLITAVEYDAKRRKVLEDI